MHGRLTMTTEPRSGQPEDAIHLLTLGELALLRDAILLTYPCDERESVGGTVVEWVLKISQRNLAAFRHSNPDRALEPVDADALAAIAFDPNAAVNVRTFAPALSFCMIAEDGTDFSTHELMVIVANLLAELLLDILNGVTPPTSATPARASGADAVMVRSTSRLLH